jgi:hypothetical protein
LPVWGGSKLMGGMDGIILKFKVSHRIAWMEDFHKDLGEMGVGKGNRLGLMISELFISNQRITV